MAALPNISSQREFAVEVVRRLREAGFTAYWAGGCVRDDLLGREPMDYDVATNAVPDEVRRIFGHDRTLAIGAAFGVIGVLGRKGLDPIEVATFRQDAKYSDGRHPDGVRYSTPEEDSQRRDFTVNGLFYDPLQQRIIDYVGGQKDLQRRVIRAIGDADARIAEDKLRMLRAVRFSATYKFALDATTQDAVRRHAAKLTVVSGERIAQEMQRMLKHSTRRRAIELLQDTNLLRVALPELQEVDATAWGPMLHAAEQLGKETSFASALAILLRMIGTASATRTEAVLSVAARWKLPNDVKACTNWLLTQESTILNARNVAWPQLQRVLINPHADQLLTYAQAIAISHMTGKDDVQFCRTQLARPVEQLNPQPLIDGNDLRALGIPPGAIYKQLLETIRDAQLEDQLSTKTAALKFAYQRWSESRQ